MKLWEKVKHFFYAHKRKESPSSHKKNIASEKSKVQYRLEEIREINLKTPIDISVSNEQKVIQESELYNVSQELRSEVSEASILVDKQETKSKAETNSPRNIVDELVKTETNMRFKTFNKMSDNDEKKKNDISNIKKPTTPMPNYNAKTDFKRHKEDYKYYLIKGSEYEQIRAIQSIKRAVREKESNYEEWLAILLDVNQTSSKKIKKYILDTLKSFPLKIEESRTVEELIPLERIAVNINDEDLKLEKPRVIASRTVEDRVKQFNENETEEIKKIPVKKTEAINLEANTDKTPVKKIGQKLSPLQTYSSKTVNQLRLTEKERIKAECLNRNITSIYHFTNARNVKKILQYGILPLNELERRKIGFEANDKERWDGMKNSTCWSISFPNNKYFYRVRERYRDMKWCVIEADASLLFDLECYFFETNAASNTVKVQTASSRKGYSSFTKMFTRRSSEDEILPSNYTTDVQAEVLIAENVKPDRIKAIHTQDETVFDYYHKLYPHLVKSTPPLFKVRP